MKVWCRFGFHSWAFFRMEAEFQDAPFGNRKREVSVDLCAWCKKQRRRNGYWTKWKTHMQQGEDNAPRY